MQRLSDILVAVCRVGTAIAFLVLIGTVLTQVIGRSVVNSSPPWTEELTRYSMLWMIACAAGLSFRSGDLVNVDILSDALPGRWPWLMRLVSALATAGLCAVLIYPAWRYMAIGVRQTSPVLTISMNFIYASVLAVLVLLLVFSLVRVMGMLTGATDGRPVFNEDREV